MRLYLAAAESLELIRHLRAVDGGRLEGKPVRKRTLNDAINTVRQVKELDAAAQLLLGHLDFPIHAFVADRAKGTSTHRLITHVLSPVPNGAFLDIGHGICICTPQFAFLQMGAQTDFLGLLRIGMELCGGYAYFPSHDALPAGNAWRAGGTKRGCVFQLPPASQAYRLQAFVDRMNGQRGAVGARAAARWLLDRSASPMETAIYLLLCLPKRLGGYGLPKPTLNPKLQISNPDGMKERYPDLFWLGANIDVEYNSDSAHSGEWARYRDSKREVELTVASVKVLPLTRPQLMDVEEFDAFANGLRRMLGIRSRKGDAAWLVRRGDLRQRLLSDWNP